MSQGSQPCWSPTETVKKLTELVNIFFCTVLGPHIQNCCRLPMKYQVWSLKILAYIEFRYHRWFYLFLFCGHCCNHQTSWFHVHWSFTLEPIIQKYDESYNVPKYGAKNKLPIRCQWIIWWLLPSLIKSAYFFDIFFRMAR